MTAKDEASCPARLFCDFVCSGSASAKLFVMSCGLVMMEPTTTLKAPSSMTRLAFSGVLIFPSAMTRCLTEAMIFRRISKSLASIRASLLCSV